MKSLLFSPISGTVKEVNGELATAPEKINSDAHGSWMIKVELSDTSHLNSLLSSADYEAYVKERGDH